MALLAIVVTCFDNNDGYDNTCIITDEVCHKETGSCKDCYKYKSSKYYKEVKKNG
jgi:hypothetical protein